MFLLGCPASTITITSRCRGDSAAALRAAAACQAARFPASRDWSSARLTPASRSGVPAGFLMKPIAPAFIAPTAMVTSPWPVTTMAGRRCPAALSRRSTSSPLMPGMAASTNRQPSRPGRNAAKSASPPG